MRNLGILRKVVNMMELRWNSIEIVNVSSN